MFFSTNNLFTIVLVTALLLALYVSALLSAIFIVMFIMYYMITENNDIMKDEYEVLLEEQENKKQ